MLYLELFKHVLCVQNLASILFSDFRASCYKGGAHSVLSGLRFFLGLLFFQIENTLLRLTGHTPCALRSHTCWGVVSLHVWSRIWSGPMPSKCCVPLTAVVGMWCRQRQRPSILIIRASWCTHSVWIGNQPATHLERRREKDNCQFGLKRYKQYIRIRKVTRLPASKVPARFQGLHALGTCLYSLQLSLGMPLRHFAPIQPKPVWKSDDTV